jgi:hypothetical protein
MQPQSRPAEWLLTATEALQAFYAGREDPLTLGLLAHSGSE